MKKEDIAQKYNQIKKSQLEYKIINNIYSNKNQNKIFF